MILSTDFNLDGRADLISAKKWTTETEVVLPTGNVTVTTYFYDLLISVSQDNGAYATPIKIYTFVSGDYRYKYSDLVNQISLVDFDKDNRSELYILQNYDPYSSLNIFGTPLNFTGFSFDKNSHIFVPVSNLITGFSWPKLYPNDQLSLMPVNIDGKADNNQILMLLRTPVSMFILFPVAGDETIYPPSIVFNTGINQQRQLYLIDFNGNGKMDIASVTNSECTIYEYNDGTGHYAAIYSDPIINLTKKFHFGDFNGDGNTDALIDEDPLITYTEHTLHIFYSNGNLFIVKAVLIKGLGDLSVLHNYSFSVNDFDGDGKSDILAGGLYGHALFLVRSDGDKFVFDMVGTAMLYYGYIEPDLSLCVFGDFNGDGKCDMYSNGNNLIYYFRNNDASHFVTRIIDGMNNVYKYSYSTLTSDKRPLNSYHSYNNLFTTYDSYGLYRGPLSIVTSLGVYQYDNTLIENTDYSYSDATYDKRGKGLLGFTQVVQNHTTATKYGTMEVSNFELYSEIPANPNSLSFMYLASTTSSNYIDDPQISYPVIVSESVFSYELDPNVSQPYSPYLSRRYLYRPTSTLSKDFLNNNSSFISYGSYDNYGNSQSVLKYNYIGTGVKPSNPTTSIPTTLITNTYATAGSWCPNKLSTQSARNRKPSLGEDKTRNISYTYDSHGNLLTMTKDPGLAKSSTTTYEYTANPFGLPNRKTLTTTEPYLSSISNSSQYVYDSKGRFVLTEINALGQQLVKTFEPIHGNVISVTDIDGKMSGNTYNGFGRLVSSTDKLGIITNYYKSWETTTATGSTYSEYAINPDVPNSRVWFDNIGRKILSSATSANNVIEYVAYYYWDPVVKSLCTGWTKPYSVTPSKQVILQFDVYNRLINKNDQGRVTEISYSNIADASFPKAANMSTTTIIDAANPANNQIVTNRLNENGQVVYVTDNGGTVEYTYNANGQVKQINALGAVTNITYDAYDNQLTLSDPDAGIINYEYNAFGQLHFQTDITGNRTTTLYDVAGRPVSKTITDITNTPLKTNIYTYYATNPGINQVQSISSGDVSESFIYDAFGRIKEITENITSQSFTTSYTYNAKGYLNTITYPSGFKIKKEYDSKGRVSKIINATTNQSIWEVNNYNELDQITSTTVGGGMRNSYVYEPLYNSLTEISLKNFSNTNIYKQSYVFDHTNGNLISRQDNLKGILEEFTYDALDRLKTCKINGGIKLSLTYDNNGNILTKSNVSAEPYIYSATKPHAVISIANTVSNVPSISPTQNITYNASNRAVTINQDIIDQLEFTYGFDDQRRKSVLLNFSMTQNTKYYVGDYEKEIKPGNIINEYHYIYAPTGLVAVMIKQGSTQNMYYTCTDYEGTVTALVNANGTIVEEYNTDAWGLRRNPSNWNYYSGTPPSSLISRIYIGEEHLDKFGLINLNARLYDPVLGRMLSPDNYVEPNSTQNYNRYSYALNNPLKYTDKDGNNPISIAMIIGATLFGGYSGYQIGQTNHASGLGMAGYVVGGALIGGVSGGLGVGIANSGVLLANTFGIMTGSFVNSVGMKALSGGKTDVSIGFGIASYNFDKNDWGYLGEDGNSGGEDFGYVMGGLGNLGDIANVVDRFTHWEEKLANKSKAYMDQWVKDHPDAVVDPGSLHGNGGTRSYPSYFNKNPRYWNSTSGRYEDYMGMVDDWGWKEYPGYLHDAEYIAAGISKGAKYLLGSWSTYGADIRLTARTLFLSLKHNSPFDLVVGGLLSVDGVQKLPYGWLIRKP